MKKIIAVGPLTSKNPTSCSGQSMMFSLFVHYLQDKLVPLRVVNIASKDTKRISGTKSFLRVMEYLWIVIKIFFIFLINPRQQLYITTAQSKVGAMRDILIIKLAKIFKYRIIAHQFGANYANFYNAQTDRFRKILKNTLDATSAIVVESDNVKGAFSFVSSYETKVTVIPNGLPELNLQASNTGKSYNKNEPFKIIYLSNMIESKGYWDVLNAVDLLVNTRKRNVFCTFAGKFLPAVDDQFVKNKNPEKIFFDFINTHNLENNIAYQEGLWGEVKATAFTSSHVFALPSYYINEGQPVSVIEAMAYGAIPIVTRYRLIPEMVTDTCGIFVPPKDPVAIADAIEKLMEDIELYKLMSQAAIDRYLSKFTSEKYCTLLIRLFNK